MKKRHCLHNMILYSLALVALLQVFGAGCAFSADGVPGTTPEIVKEAKDHLRSKYGQEFVIDATVRNKEDWLMAHPEGDGDLHFTLKYYKGGPAGPPAWRDNYATRFALKELAGLLDPLTRKSFGTPLEFSGHKFDRTYLAMDDPLLDETLFRPKDVGSYDDLAGNRVRTAVWKNMYVNQDITITNENIGEVSSTLARFISQVKRIEENIAFHVGYTREDLGRDPISSDVIKLGYAKDAPVPGAQEIEAKIREEHPMLMEFTFEGASLSGVQRDFLVDGRLETSWSYRLSQADELAAEPPWVKVSFQNKTTLNRVKLVLTLYDLRSQATQGELCFNGLELEFSGGSLQQVVFPECPVADNRNNRTVVQEVNLLPPVSTLSVKATLKGFTVGEVFHENRYATMNIQELYFLSGGGPAEPGMHGKAMIMEHDIGDLKYLGTKDDGGEAVFLKKKRTGGKVEKELESFPIYSGIYKNRKHFPEGNFNWSDHRIAVMIQDYREAISDDELKSFLDAGAIHDSYEPKNIAGQRIFVIRTRNPEVMYVWGSSDRLVAVYPSSKEYSEEEMEVLTRAYLEKYPSSVLASDAVPGSAPE